MVKISTEIKQEKPEFSAYLTFKLDLVKSEMVRRANLTYRQELGLDVRSLRLLRAVCDNAGLTATDLRELTLIEKTILSKDLAELISLKLIRRSIHPDDARHHQLWPTARGKKLRAASDNLGHKMESAMLSVLSPDEQGHLNQLLDKLSKEFLANAGQKQR